MYLSVGGYDFAPNRVWFTIDRSSKVSVQGYRVATNHVWHINGWVGGEGSTVNSISAEIMALEAALVHNVDVIWKTDAGADLAHSLRASDCVNGTQITKPSWRISHDGQKGSGAEYVNRRSFHFTVSGTTLDVDAPQIVQWRESLHFIGNGGPRFVAAGSLNGPVQMQQTQLYTPYRCIQSGRAVGLTSWLIPATPLFPDYEHVDQRRYSEESPMSLGATPLYYPNSWSYFFEGAAEMVGGLVLP